MAMSVNLRGIYPQYKAEILGYTPSDDSDGSQYADDEYSNAGPSNARVFQVGVLSHPEVSEIELRASLREVGNWPVAGEVELQLPRQ